MSTSRQASAWIVGVVLALPAVSGAQDRSERELVELIVREGPQAAAIRAGAEIVRREQLARQVPGNPSVSYSREAAGFAEFFQVEQSVGFLSVRRSLSRAGSAAVDAGEAERDARLWRLRADALVSLTQLAAAERRREVADEHRRELERLLGVLRTREREGEGSRWDRLRAEEELRDVQMTAADASVAVAERRAVVTAMLPAGAAVGAVVRPALSDTPTPALDMLLAQSVAARRELRALQAGEQRALQEALVARRSRLPFPTVFGGIKRSDEATARAAGAVLGVGVTLPLFDTGARESARWDAERIRVNAERQSLEHQIRTEVSSAFEVWKLRQAALAETVDAGLELLRIAEVAYREGEVGILELLDAVRTVSRARTRQVDRHRDARLAQIAVERAVGEVVWP